MKPQPEGPTKDDPIYIGGSPAGPIIAQPDWLDLPLGLYEGANRYDTDDEHCLHLWRGGRSWDVRVPKADLT